MARRRRRRRRAGCGSRRRGRSSGTVLGSMPERGVGGTARGSGGRWPSRRCRRREGRVPRNPGRAAAEGDRRHRQFAPCGPYTDVAGPLVVGADVGVGGGGVAVTPPAGQDVDDVRSAAGTATTATSGPSNSAATSGCTPRSKARHDEPGEHAGHDAERQREVHAPGDVDGTPAELCRVDRSPRHGWSRQVGPGGVAERRQSLLVLVASRALIAVASRSIAALDDSVTMPQCRALVVLDHLGGVCRVSRRPRPACATDWWMAASSRRLIASSSRRASPVSHRCSSVAPSVSSSSSPATCVPYKCC